MMHNIGGVTRLSRGVWHMREMCFLAVLTVAGWWLPVAHAVAQSEVRLRVCDSVTGQPLSQVSVSQAQGKRAWSNGEGSIDLDVMRGDTLRLSCPGYASRTVVAGEGGGQVALVPLREAREQPADGPALAAKVLHEVATRMQADMKGHGKATSEYYIRQDNEVEGNRHLIEGVLEARDAGCLVRAKMLAGNHYSAEDVDQPFKYSNLHYTLSLGPVGRWGELWSNLDLPLMRRRPHRGAFRYETDYWADCRLLVSDDGSQRLYRVTLTHNPRSGSLRFVHGTLLVDAATLLPVSFEGDTEGLEMRLHSHIGWRNVPMSVHMRIDYTCHEGYLQVLAMSTWCRCEGVDCRTVVVRNSDGTSSVRAFPNDRANMLSRQVYVRDREGDTSLMPLPRTAAQTALVQEGVKGNKVKTFTRY